MTTATTPESAADVLQAADAARERMVAEGRGWRDVLSDERILFARLGWSNQEIGERRRALQQALQLKARAGTAQERAAAEQEAREADTEAEHRVDAIDEQIRQLQAERAELIGRRDSLRTAANNMSEALAELKSRWMKLLPPSIDAQRRDIQRDPPIPDDEKRQRLADLKAHWIK